MQLGHAVLADMDMAVIALRTILVRSRDFGEFMRQADLRPVRVPILTILMHFITMQVNDFTPPFIVKGMVIAQQAVFMRVIVNNGIRIASRHHFLPVL